MCQTMWNHAKMMEKLKRRNSLILCNAKSASGVWEFPPQGLNSRLRSWGSCAITTEYSKRVKVGHNSGLLACSRRRYLAYEKGRVRKSCVSFSSWRQVCHTKIWPSGVSPNRHPKCCSTILWPHWQDKTLPEAQRTQGMDTITWVTSPAWYLVAIYKTVSKSRRGWHLMYWFQSWPPDLSLIHCLEMPYGHYQLLLSWYVFQPESHQLSLQNLSHSVSDRDWGL